MQNSFPLIYDERSSECIFLNLLPKHILYNKFTLDWRWIYWVSFSDPIADLYKWIICHSILRLNCLYDECFKQWWIYTVGWNWVLWRYGGGGSRRCDCWQLDHHLCSLYYPHHHFHLLYSSQCFNSDGVCKKTVFADNFKQVDFWVTKTT